MEIQDKIKKWVVLDNQQKKLNNQIKILRDEKNELTSSIINYFDLKNANYPTINISDGKLSFIETKQANLLSYKFLEKCLDEFFENFPRNTEISQSSNIQSQILEFIKSQRTYNITKNIKRVYNKNSLQNDE